MKDQVLRYGVWKVGNTWSPTLAKELESLGYGALWIGGSKDSELLVAEELLGATSTVVVATGIINVWSTDPDIVGQAFHRLEERYPGRFLLGVGAGHRESNQTVYDKPYTAVKHYLDRLDAADVPQERRVLRPWATTWCGCPAVGRSALTRTSQRRRTRGGPGTYWAHSPPSS